MRKLLIALCCLLFAAPTLADVLIVADEIPAMKVLAEKLKAAEGVESRIVTQADMPADISGFSAVLVYIHRELSEPAEKAFIGYANAGGKLIVLHHSISSGKRKNKEWFKFLGITLPQGELAKGGYKYYEGIEMELVNLAPAHFITTNKLTYPATIAWKSPEPGAAEKPLPGFKLKETEVYLNHVLNGPHTLLLGLKFADAKSSQTYMQATAGWMKPAGKGTVIYLMPGHSQHEFADPTYSRIVTNAVIFKP